VPPCNPDADAADAEPTSDTTDAINTDGDGGEPEPVLAERKSNWGRSVGLAEDSHPLLCQDFTTDCVQWYNEGMCESQAAWMTQYCMKSCGLCPTPAPTEALCGEETYIPVDDEAVEEDDDCTSLEDCALDGGDGEGEDGYGEVEDDEGNNEVDDTTEDKGEDGEDGEDGAGGEADDAEGTTNQIPMDDDAWQTSQAPVDDDAAAGDDDCDEEVVTAAPNAPSLAETSLANRFMSALKQVL